MDELDSLIKKVTEKNNEAILGYAKEVEEIIKSNLQDEGVISGLFNRLLNAEFADKTLVNKEFYKLINYVMTFNKELAAEYSVLYVEKNNKQDNNYNNFTK